MNKTLLLEQKRLAWACRRGTLELDLLLSDYLQQRYPSAPFEDKLQFQRLLGSEDELLTRWLIKREMPEDAKLNNIIIKILADESLRCSP